MLLLMHQSFIPSKLLPVFLLSQKFNHFLSVIAISGKNLLKFIKDSQHEVHYIALL